MPVLVTDDSVNFSDARESEMFDFIKEQVELQIMLMQSSRDFGSVSQEQAAFFLVKFTGDKTAQFVSQFLS